ncbi:hypothetical protein J40TS1_23490 [Paenibacillus montaniterrae]|uniref:Uncharacterized protein n=1 Tax=Paenibacillus montaniterrae TaxID=429341 RepID=A0A919YP16_9BACL|nr:DUF5665 domain-containing protein [Paenibacillus montaniterrae]GIP16707.1 hypothetical protein J40TS1_23490 [Paenibacillus montaniterrae]
MPVQDHDELSQLKKSLDSIEQRLIKVTNDLERTQIADYVNLMNRPMKLLWRNLMAGVARGVGTAIGWVFLATFVLYLLQMLGALNLPIIGDYIADIVRIVQNQLDVDR